MRSPAYFDSMLRRRRQLNLRPYRWQVEEESERREAISVNFYFWRKWKDKLYREFRENEITVGGSNGK